MKPLSRSGAAIAVIVIALTGCSTVTSTPESSDPVATATSEPSGPGIAPTDGGIYPVHPATHPHVQLDCPLIPAIHYVPAEIPAGDVDGAYTCTAEPWTPAPDGTPQLVQYVDRVAQDDVVGLLAAYAAPDAEPAGGACDSEPHDPLIVWLHVTQEIIPVYAPRDECGLPTEAAIAAYQGVELHRLLVAREKENT